MSTQSHTAQHLLVPGLHTDREAGLRVVSISHFRRLVGMTALLFSCSLLVGADPVQYPSGVCPENYFMGCLFDHWLWLLRCEQGISFIVNVLVNSTYFNTEALSDTNSWPSRYLMISLMDRTPGHSSIK